MSYQVDFRFKHKTTVSWLKVTPACTPFASVFLGKLYRSTTFVLVHLCLTSVGTVCILVTHEGMWQNAAICWAGNEIWDYFSSIQMSQTYWKHGYLSSKYVLLIHLQSLPTRPTNKLLKKLCCGDSCFAFIKQNTRSLSSSWVSLPSASRKKESGKGKEVKDQKHDAICQNAMSLWAWGVGLDPLLELHKGIMSHVQMVRGNDVVRRWARHEDKNMWREDGWEVTHLDRTGWPLCCSELGGVVA